MALTKIRLYVDHSLSQGQSVPLNREQSHYLIDVMRLETGDELLIFNGRDGEFRASVDRVSKRNGALMCRSQTKQLQMPPDLWLLFAPIKKSRTDFIVEKATEMGAARIIPVRTDHTNNDRVRQDKLRAHAVEAAEQCGGTFVPTVTGLQKLEDVLANWPQERRLLFCDENLAGTEESFVDKSTGSWAILIGPEGGFSEQERDRLYEMDQTVSISLGPRILRSDTAVVAALTVWQTTLGDW